jgi:hypothetical protein
VMTDREILELAANQCQGCQAGWPIKEHSPWPSGSKQMRFHEVAKGYPGELVMCTAHRYRAAAEIGAVTNTSDPE